MAATLLRMVKRAVSGKRPGAVAELPQNEPPGQLTLPPTDLEVVLGRLREARRARLSADEWERFAVTAARAQRLSWDRIGESLGLSGESLRRRHGGGRP